jgi:predicted PurR-regulated permease PerM
VTPAPDGEVAAARRRHAIFLVVTAAIVVAVLVVSHEVLLPFVFALVIAYLLTPLVAWVEARPVPAFRKNGKPGVPRFAAILVVYVVVLGALAGFVRLTAPRVGHELASLRRELPSIARTIKVDWVPAIQGRLRSVGFGKEPPPAPGAPVAPSSQAPPTPAAPAPPEAPEAPDAPDAPDAPAGGAAPAEAPPPSIVARPRADGSFAIEIHGPLEVRPTKNGGYVIDDEHRVREPGFDVDRLVADFASKSVSYAQQNAVELVKIGRDIIAGVSRAVFVFGITLMLAAYLMLTRERILAFFQSLVRPPSRGSFRDLLARIDRGLAGVVRGQIIICLVNGALSAVGFAIVGLKYWPVLALVATVFSLIPIFGSIASAIPAVALGLTQSFGTAVFVLVWIIGIHQLEANVLNPKILGDAAKIHPVLVIFSLLVGEHFFQITGALLAVPCMSIAQSVFIHVRRMLQEGDPEMAGEPVGSIAPPPPPAA